MKILKNRLSEYVRLAALGETILVTNRDRVVAELVPPDSTRNLVLADAELVEAAQRGWITPPVLAATGSPPRKPVMPFRDLLLELERDRSER